MLRRLHEAGHRLPAIMITGNSDVAIAVEAMKAGASASVTLLSTMATTVTTFTVCTSGTAVSPTTGATVNWTDLNCGQVITK